MPRFENEGGPKKPVVEMAVQMILDHHPIDRIANEVNISPETIELWYGPEAPASVQTIKAELVERKGEARYEYFGQSKTLIAKAYKAAAELLDGDDPKVRSDQVKFWIGLHREDTLPPPPTIQSTTAEPAQLAARSETLQVVEAMREITANIASMSGPSISDDPHIRTGHNALSTFGPSVDEPPTVELEAFTFKDDE